MNGLRHPSSAAMKIVVPPNLCGLETLEGRMLLAANPVTARRPDEAITHVSATLLSLYDAVINGQRAAEAAQAAQFRIDAQERVGVTIRADDVAKVAKSLATIGFAATASYPSLHFVEGLLPVRALRVVASVASKLGRFVVTPNFAAITQAGAVNSQGDAVMEADRVRGTTTGSFDGAGVKVGVLSDSYNLLGGAGADIASGDLPAGVQLVQEGPTGADEGRAMLQIIHDLAPGASLAFATAVSGQGAFANNIRDLANPAIGNASVIVDDVGYLDEPMFQDGVIAQAIDEVVTTRGVSYFSAAGNQSNQAYESTSFSTDVATNPKYGGTGSFYDFDPSAGVDTKQRITVANNARVRLAFQWDDPFYTASGVNTDLDLYLVDSVTGAVVASSEFNNIANQTPFETVNFVNTSGASMQLDLMVLKFAGPDSGRIKYVNYGSTSGVTIVDFPTSSSTVSPHAAAVNAQAVAAVPWFNQTAAEGFTSRGPSTILTFSAAGVPTGTTVRQTPQIAAVDGVNTTFFGGNDLEGDGRPNFFGTSAAAPHAAAVAALVRQANPGFTPAQVYSRLQTTADDITAAGAGFDNITGFGLVNAYDAVYPTVTPASVNFFDGLESGVLSNAYDTRSTGNGRIQVTNANGPATGVRHVTMDTSLVTGSAGLNELTLHVNAAGNGDKILSFRQREFDSDEDDVMPATFTNSSNSDGVAISVDGVNWFRVVSLTGATSTTTYTLSTFNLTQLAANAGITLTSDTRIRFQQYDDFPIGLGDGMAFDDIAVSDAIPPTVTGVFVSGTSWNGTFLNFLQTSGQGDATYGYRLDAAAHADELPWTNLNKVSVRFSENVVVHEDDLALSGVNVAAYAIVPGSLTYDPVSFTATWTLNTSGITADKLLLRIDGAAAGVTDANGNLLDGEWTNPPETTPITAGGADSFPSGDGTPGGDFAFRLNVLPGDVTRSGSVLSNDVTLVRNAQNATPGQSLYTAFKDLNGSGTILSNDVTLVRNRQNSSLPDGTP